MQRRTKQKLGPVRASRSIAGSKSKRQAYADFRYLVSLETVVKQLKTRLARRKIAELSKPTSSDSQAPALHSPAFQVELAREDSIAKNESASVSVSSSVLLVVDQRISMFYGSKQKTKSVVAAEAAAFVAWREFKHHNAVATLIFNDRGIVELWPGCSRVQIMLILHDLLNQNHSLSNTIRRSSSGMLNQALRRAQALVGSNFRTVLVSDGAGSDEQTASLLVNIARQNQLIMFRVYDPGQVGPGNIGSFIADGYSACQNLIESHPSSNGIAVIPLNTCGDVSRQIRRAGFVRLFAAHDHRRGLREQPTAPAQNQSSRRNTLVGATKMEPAGAGTCVPPSSSSPEKPQLLCA